MKRRLALLALILALSFPLFAEEESYTITTYYPSPYGSYNELQVYRSVRYMPVNKDTLADPKEGEVVYNGSDDKFYYYNGSSWARQAGGSTVYYTKCLWSRYLNCSTRTQLEGCGMWCSQWVTYYDCSIAGSESCNPPACASGYTSLSVGCSSSGSGTLSPGTYKSSPPGGTKIYGSCERACLIP